MIRRANLDALWSREPGTVYGNLNEAKRVAKLAAGMGMESLPTINEPVPVKDVFGMRVATLILARTLDPGRNRETVQFNTARKIRSVYSSYMQANFGYADEAVMAKDDKKLFLTSSVTYGRWFERFSKGCHNRMGDQPKPDKALTIEVLKELLALWEMEYNGLTARQDKQGKLKISQLAMFVLAGFLGGLRGEEIILMDLKALNRHLSEGINWNPPHVGLPLVGRFKNEDGTRWFWVPISVETKSGIRIDVWANRLVRAYNALSIFSGWVFRGPHDETKGKISHFDPSFHESLRTVQRLRPDLIKPDEDVADEYSLRRSLRRGSTTHAKNSGIPEEHIEYNNRWRKQQRAKGKAPSLSMIHHYTDIKEALPSTLRYSKGL